MEELRKMRLIHEMSDSTLLATWRALMATGDDDSDYNGLSYQEWAELLYSELSLRGIKAV